MGKIIIIITILSAAIVVLITGIIRAFAPMTVGTLIGTTKFPDVLRT